MLGFALFFVWLNNDAQTISLFSPQWLLALLHDFIPAAQTVVLFLVAGISGWRGYRLAQKHFLSDDIDRFFTWGVVVLLVVMGIFLLQFYVKTAALVAFVTHISPQIPALLTATFFICVLTARSLQNISYIRRFHRTKLWGSVARQERIIWFSMLLLGLAIITITRFVGDAAVFIAQGHVPSRKVKSVAGVPLHSPGGSIQAHSAPSILFILILIVMTVLVLFLVLLWFWRRWQKLQRLAKQPKKPKVRTEKEKKAIDETHETVFNWSLFLGQLFAVLARLNPFRKRHKIGAANMLDDIRFAEPMTRSIREVYRALLKKAASRGQTRAQDETPYEFWQRLGQQETLTKPELEQITEAYVLARYSGGRPGASEVARVKQLWSELKHKWL